ncbi:acyltransferase [Mucilaginibacter sp. JRF]|uniref:acyltransferase family protein n=1 Tax=Mucilaginibacter sp. JRF TaxID=2780088 RepID=UPI001882682C|nr:acyltransferase [Mucilaginibacter sp. JRF]MBE9583140.1 acyltransferase [Mucilaginibacter sp. JRF]
MNTSGTSRVHNLDYLRGMSALGIMVYHHALWLLGVFDADTFLGRLGLYGVSVFYVLSGLTLYIVYADRFQITALDIKNFILKRVFRIYPLLCLVTLSTVFLADRNISAKSIVLNVTGAFGFVAWNKAIAVGAWSIGNELVFYVFFLIFMILLLKQRALFWLLAAVIYGLAIYFAFFKIDASKALPTQFGIYQNPLNQVFLFLSGFLLGHFFKKVSVNAWVAFGIIVTGILIFTFYPVYGDRTGIITGVNRIVFSVLCILICLGFYKFKVELPKFLHVPLLFFGEISYSIYLLHPLIFDGLKKALPQSSDVLFVSLSFVIAFTLSYAVYMLIERRFVRIGGKLTKHKIAN